MVATYRRTNYLTAIPVLAMKRYRKLSRTEYALLIE